MSRRPTSCPSRIPSVVLSPIVFSAAKRGPALSCGDAPQQRPMLSVVSPLIAPSAVPGVGEPKYTPLPRPKGLTVGILAPGDFLLYGIRFALMNAKEADMRKRLALERRHAHELLHVDDHI